MLRNRLRTLEQQVNAAELPDDVKVKLQGYISGCYGTLTSFNVLFADEDDQFKGSGQHRPIMPRSVAWPGQMMYRSISAAASSFDAVVCASM